MRSRCCLCVCITLIVTRQRLGRNVTAVTNTHATIRVVFNVARVVSRKVGDYLFPELLVCFEKLLIQLEFSRHAVYCNRSEVDQQETKQPCPAFLSC
jgi:hypothetical protein